MGVCNSVSPLGELFLDFLYWSAWCSASGWRSSVKSWQLMALTLLCPERSWDTSGRKRRCAVLWLSGTFVAGASTEPYHVCPTYCCNRRTWIFNHNNIICLACRDQKVVIIFSERENANLKWDDFKVGWGFFFFSLLCQALIWLVRSLLPCCSLLSLKTVIAVLTLPLCVVLQCYFLMCSSFNGSKLI